MKVISNDDKLIIETAAIFLILSKVIERKFSSAKINFYLEQNEYLYLR